MKKIAFALVLAVLGACGTPKNDGHSNVLSSAAASNNAPATLVFAVDLRPVDGDLKEIKLVKSTDGKYDATLRVAYFDRVNNRSVDETSELASGMTCQISKRALNKLAKVVCSVDLRPVDGDLRELTIERNVDKTFKASLRVAYFDRIHGTPVDETKEIADGLKMN